MAVKLEVKLEAQAISKIKEHFDSMNGFAHIMEGLREGYLIEKDAATMIDGIKDKTKRNRQLYEEIVKVVNESNFKKICLVLRSVDYFITLVSDVWLFYSILSSVIEMDAEEMHLDALLQTLTIEQFLTEAENDQINKHKLYGEPNQKQSFISLLSSKALNCFSDFLHHLENETMYNPLHAKILRKMSEINNDISVTSSVSTNTPSTTNSPSNSLKKEIQHQPSQLDTYSEHLKHIHQRLPTLSRQGWINSSSTEDHFINVTVVKSQKVGKNNEYSTSSHEILDHQIQYSGEALKLYNKMFEAIDSKSHQLVLLEGNAGTGKTTLAFKFCKDWAVGNVLSQYSHVMLLQLRDIKVGMINKPEQLFSKMGKLKHHIYAEMVVCLGSGVLFWLEGWDELDDDLKIQSVFTDLLSGQLFPKATVVVSTRPSATGSLKEFCNFTHKFKLVGFACEQIEEYVHCYCTDSKLAESFMSQLKHVPSLAQLAEVPMNLAILVKLFKQTNQDLPNTLTEIFHDYLLNILQHHKDKNLKGRGILRSTHKLPPEMQKVFDTLTKYAFDCMFHNKPFSEEEISDILFDSAEVPWDFDGLGLLGVQNRERVTGESKDYIFLYKPIQELLAALYLTKLDPKQQLIQLKEIFGSKINEMVWVFYTGITGLHVVTIDILLQEKLQSPQQSVTQLPAKTLQELVKIWKHCHSYFMHMTISDEFNAEFLLTLILCCYEARNKEACRIIAMHVYPDIVCRIEIPPNRVTPYLLLAVSYFISHSGKLWSLRCDASIQCGVELLCTYITEHDLDETSIYGGLWVWCYVVKSSQIDAYCKAIKSQSSLQWIHLLNGSSLGDDGTVKLCDCLSFDCTVIKVEIENCKIGSRGLKSIARMLNINGKILHIDLRKNSFLLQDVLDFLSTIKNQIYLEYLLLDKEFTENSKVISIFDEINSIRKTKNSRILKISHR